MYYIADWKRDKVGEAKTLKQAKALCPKGGEVYKNLSPYARKVFHFG